MTDWRSSPRTGKSQFYPNIPEIQRRLSIGETSKQIHDALTAKNVIVIGYDQFIRYIRKLHKQNIGKTYMLDRQVNDEKALQSLTPFIDALKASISMQKAVANHLVDLEKLRAYGYSNGFISAAVSNGSGRTISAGLFASMMYRAKMKAEGKSRAKTLP